MRNMMMRCVVVAVALAWSSATQAAHMEIVLSAPQGAGPLGSHSPGAIVPVTVALRSSGAAVPNVSVIQLDLSLCTPSGAAPSVTFAPQLQGGAVVTSPDGSIVRWSHPGRSTPLTVPAAPQAVAVATFNVAVPAAGGLSAGVNVLGPIVGDGGASGAFINDVLDAVWENGDANTFNNIIGGVLPLTADPGHPPREVLLSTLASHPHSLAPAGAGLPAGTRLTSLDRPFRSADGHRWIMSAATNAPASSDQIIITGAAGSAWTTATVLREGAPAPWAPGQVIGPFNRRDMGINNAGQFALIGVTTAAAANESVVTFNGADFITVAREGSPIPNVPGESFGGGLQCPHILADGSVGFMAMNTVGSLPNDADDFLMRGLSIVLQQGVVPAGQVGNLPLVSFTPNDFRHSSDGAHWIANASLAGTTENRVILVDGEVVLQENTIIAGSGFSSPIGFAGGVEPQMMPSGDWLVRGENFDGADWIVRNGTVAARTDQPVHPQAVERFDDSRLGTCFLFMQQSPSGERVLGGATDNANPAFDVVLTLDGRGVIAREGDVVDLDGDALPGDEAFIGSFSADDGFVTDDAVLIVVNVVDSTGAALGEALIAIDLERRVEPQCPADIMPPGGNGAVNVDDLLAVINAWGMTGPPTAIPADISANGVVNVDDLLAVINAWGACG